MSEFHIRAIRGLRPTFTATVIFLVYKIFIYALYAAFVQPSNPHWKIGVYMNFCLTHTLRSDVTLWGTTPITNYIFFFNRAMSEFHIHAIRNLPPSFTAALIFLVYMIFIYALYATFLQPWNPHWKIRVYMNFCLTHAIRSDLTLWGTTPITKYTFFL